MEVINQSQPSATILNRTPRHTPSGTSLLQLPMFVPNDQKSSETEVRADRMDLLTCIGVSADPPRGRAKFCTSGYPLS